MTLMAPPLGAASRACHSAEVAATWRSGVAAGRATGPGRRWVTRRRRCCRGGAGHEREGTGTGDGGRSGREMRGDTGVIFREGAARVTREGPVRDSRPRASRDTGNAR